jgi:hypothetical protein
MLNNDEQSSGRIALGMDVCDVSGEKVGTVARLLQQAPASEIIEVKTGLFGMGKHLYVPTTEVDAITDGGLVLKYPKQEFHEVGFDARPENLTE